jgi:hypothetical protein
MADGWESEDFGQVQHGSAAQSAFMTLQCIQIFVRVETNIF